MINRQDLNTMTKISRQEFLALLQQYIDTSDAVDEHNKKSHGAHGDNFLSWHRYYLTKFEHWLHEQVKDEFIPCPAWNPGNKIPNDFIQKASTPTNEVRTGNISTLLPLKFTHIGDGLTTINSFKDFFSLNNDLQIFHDSVHSDLGGIMLTHQSPKDPIFWPFHSFLTLTYERWLYK